MKIINICLVLLFLTACTTNRIELNKNIIPQKVYFAGVSFTGNYKDNSLNYQYSYQISKKHSLDKIFTNKLKKVNNPSLKLLTSLGNSKEYDALAMSLAIDLETVNVSEINSKSYKLIIDLYSQILVFDFNEKKIINSYPINLQYISLFDHYPNKSEIKSIIEGFYTGKNSEVKTNIFDLAVNKINKIYVKPQYGNRLKVNDIKISPKVRKILKELKQPEDNFKTILAQSFSEALVNNQNVAVLPYTKGQAIGSKMPARFVNGDIYNFEIPQGDYVFNIDLVDLKNLTTEDNIQATQTQGFFTYINIELKQPDLEKIYMNSRFRGTETVILLEGQKPDLRLSYIETYMNLFNHFSQNITKKDSDWYEKTLAPDTYGKVKSEFENVENIINRCK